MTSEIVEAARIAAASGEMAEMAALRIVGPIYDALKSLSHLHTTVGVQKTITYGQVVLVVMLDEGWIQEVNEALEGTDEQGFADQFEGIWFMSLEDVHKGTWNMVKRWLGNSPLDSFGASGALDDEGLAEVREVFSQAASAEKPADLTTEFNSCENPENRAACFEMNEAINTRNLNPSAVGYNPESGWPFEPDFSRHWLSFEKIVDFLSQCTRNREIKASLEDLTQDEYKLACEAFLEKIKEKSE